MIQPRSMLDVADNSGAKKVQCIRVMGGANKRYASLGDSGARQATLPSLKLSAMRMLLEKP